MVISKLMKADAIDDWQLVQVVKDYNLCRHGSRMLYIFFEHLITEKYLQDYNAEMNRNVVEAFIAIYQNSGMCTAAFYNRMVELIG